MRKEVQRGSVSESIEWIFEISLLKLLDETSILTSCFLPGMAVSALPLKIISLSVAKVHQIPPSDEC